MERALSQLKKASRKPGYRSVEITYHQGRFRVTSRQTWDWENDT